jgi:CRP-like cAMP-binding protein
MKNESGTLNKLLAALPADDYARIASQATLVPLRARQVLHKRDEALKQVLFPNRSLCSLVVTMEDGATAEVALVGPEGIVGIEAVLGQRVAACDATVQVPGDGHALAMGIDTFRAELANSPAFASAMYRYTQAFIGFVTQSVACNGLHHVDARCCRWLLHAQDRLQTNDLPLTHDLLSTMLGVRRPTVTLVMNALLQAGIITATRGMIHIVDREMLQGRACECYRAVSGMYSRKLSPATAQENDLDTHDAAAPDRAKLVAGASNL